MEETPVDVLRWRHMSQRLVELEGDSRALRKRLLLGISFNACLLLAVLVWLVLPNRTLTAREVRADTVFADRFTTAGTTMQRDSLVIVNTTDTARMSLSMPESDTPTLSVQHDGYGQIVASVGDAPFFGMYAGRTGGDPGSSQPQIELSLVGEDKSPQIVLRDVNGQVVWHAP